MVTKNPEKPMSFDDIPPDYSMRSTRSWEAKSKNRAESKTPPDLLRLLDWPFHRAYQLLDGRLIGLINYLMAISLGLSIT